MYFYFNIIHAEIFYFSSILLYSILYLTFVVATAVTPVFGGGTDGGRVGRVPDSASVGGRSASVGARFPAAGAASAAGTFMSGLRQIRSNQHEIRPSRG